MVTASESMRFVIACVVVLQTVLLGLIWLYLPPLLPQLPGPVIAAASFVGLLALLAGYDGDRNRKLFTFVGVVPIEGIALTIGALSSYALVLGAVRWGPGTIFWFSLVLSLFLAVSSVVILGLCARRAFFQISDPNFKSPRFETPWARIFAPRRLALLAVCLLALAAAYPLKRHLDGYCYAQERFVPDVEFIEHALAYRAKYIKGLSANPTSEDLQTYLRQHPDCCTVMGPDFFLASSFRDRALGYKTTWVKIVHPLTDEERSQSSDPATHSDVYIGLNRCGRAFRKTGFHYAPTGRRDIR
jgi:hypothetical protein